MEKSHRHLLTYTDNSPMASKSMRKIPSLGSKRAIIARYNIRYSMRMLYPRAEDSKYTAAAYFVPCNFVIIKGHWYDKDAFIGADDWSGLKLNFTFEMPSNDPAGPGAGLTALTVAWLTGGRRLTSPFGLAGGLASGHDGGSHGAMVPLCASCFRVSGRDSPRGQTTQNPPTATIKCRGANHAAQYPDFSRWLSSGDNSAGEIVVLLCAWQSVPSFPLKRKNRTSSPVQSSGCGR